MILQFIRQNLQEAQTACFGTHLKAIFQESQGVFSTALPLQLAKHQGTSAREIAQKLMTAFEDKEEVQAWVTDPGFLNFQPTDAFLLTLFKSFCQTPLVGVAHPCPQGKTLSELRASLANRILQELGGEQSPRIGIVTGKFSVEEALNQIGPDALYFFLLSSPLRQPLDFQPALTVRESLGNPWYSLRHSHIRITALARFASHQDGEDAETLIALERAVMQEILSLPEACRNAKLQSDPHILWRYTLKLAGLFDELFNKKRILSPEDRNDSMRVKLALASKDVLGHALNRFGIMEPVEL